MSLHKFLCWLVALLIALAALALTAAPTWACGGGVICVNADAIGPAHDGLSWATAYTTVQAALDWTNAHTSTAHEIWVAEGVYYPDEGGSHVDNAVTETFRIAWNNVQLYGGFAATETLRTQRDWTAHPTVLSGDVDGNDINTDTNRIAETWRDLVGSNAYHVLYLDGVTNEPITGTTVSDGFVVTAGDAGGSWPHNSGGGLFCAGSGNGHGCSPALVDVLFSGNSADYRGGGMFNHGYNDGVSSPTLVNVTFDSNTAGSGGGMYNDGYGGASNPNLNHIAFNNNSAAEDGGGMCNNGTAGASNPALTDVTFSGNSAVYGGGMLNDGYVGTSNPTLTHVTFNGNSASNSGGGIFNRGRNGGVSSPTLTYVTFNGNSAGSGGGMFNSANDDGESSPTLVNCTLRGNLAGNGGGISNSGSTGGLSRPNLTNILFSGNRASNRGGGIDNYSYDGQCTPRLTNVTFAGNYASSNGGGMSNFATNDGLVYPLLYNCILWGNAAGTAGPQIYNYGGVTPNLMYSDVQGGHTGTGNINIDPQFAAPVAAGSAPTTTGDYHLQLASPAIDAGTNLIVNATTDLDGKPRRVDIPSIPDTGNGNAPIVDMGAYEARGMIYVDADAAGVNNGTSWANAYTTLQAALDQTNAYSATTFEVWVAEGVYYPDEGGAHVDDAMTETFRIAWNNVQLYGGFAATETAREQRDWTLHPTALSGDIDGNDWNTDTNRIAETWDDLVGNNAYQVLYLDGVTNEPITETTTLDGFVITAGHANGELEDNYNGGGLHCNGNGIGHACNPTLANITFSGNATINNGGGMYNNGGNGGESSPMLTHVTFSGNSAYNGGGMFNTGRYGGESSPILTHVTFSGNSVYIGGGMLNYGDEGVSNPILTDVIFRGNSATTGGGGMYSTARNGGVSSPSLTDVLFSGNRAVYAAGMFNESINAVNAPILTHVTFSGNAATDKGGGMFNHNVFGGASTPILVNCILWGNAAGTAGPQIFNDNATPTVTYSNVQWPSGIYTGAGNLNVNPQFVAPAAGNYRLSTTSPAIDAGNSLSVTVATDLDGNPRKVDLPDVANTGVGTPPVDMGAYEVQTPTLNLVKSVTPVSNVRYAGPVTYTLLLSNSGAETISGIVLTDTLPPRLLFDDWVTQPAGATSGYDGIAWTGALGGSEVLTFTFRASQGGDYEQIITNTAEFSGMGQIGAASAAFTVTSNYPPVLDAIGDRLIMLGDSLAFNATATDANGYPPLVFTLDAGSVGSITIDGAFTWTPTDTGTYTATIRVSDGDMEDSETFGIAVTTETVYTLTVNIEGNGEVQRDPNQTDYISGTEVTLTPAPATNWTFAGWSGDLIGTDNPATVVMDGDKVITATFTETLPANLAPVANAGSDQSVAPGAPVTLDGSASFDPDNHLPLAYLWQQAGGPAVSFTPTLSRTTFTAPDAPTVLTFTLTVTDSLELADPTPDTVVITVSAYRIYLPLILRGAP